MNLFMIEPDDHKITVRNMKPITNKEKTFLQQVRVINQNSEMFSKLTSRKF